MNNKKLKICDVTVHPGEEASLSLPLPEYYSCAPLYMPIRIIHGKKKGPCLLVFSTLNGNELNGIEIVNRIMEGTKASQISGTIIAIPVLNVYGLTNFPKVLPSGGTLNGCFPGTKSGTYGERFAHVFTQEILKKADYCIELQTGKLNHNILPQVYCDLENLATRKLAKAFNAPVIMNITLQDSSLRRAAESLHIPLLAYQAGEAMRFDQNAIEVGFNGVKNIMRYIDMLPKAPIEEVRSIISQDEEWVVAHKGGILHTDSSLGQVIKKGQVIGTISDPFGAGESEKLKSPKNGIIVGINTTPLIHEGLSIFKISSFIDYNLAETTIEEWDKKQEDSFLS